MSYLSSEDVLSPDIETIPVQPPTSSTRGLDGVFFRIDKVSAKDEKLIIFGQDLSGQKIVGKVEIVEEEYPTAVEYEAAIYAQVIDPIMTNRECANLVTSVAWVPDMPLPRWYNEIRRIGQPVHAQNGTRSFVNMVRDEFGTDVPMSTLVTAVPPNLRGSLTETIAEFGSNWRVLFQIGYTLTACEAAGLSHNDDHTSNWLLSTDMPKVYYAISEHEMIPIEGLRVWLFDWDLAYATQLDDNPILGDEGCDNMGMCNSVNGLRDLALVMCSMEVTDNLGACETPNEKFMWRELKSMVCNNTKSDYPCHLSTKNLASPGVNALEYVLKTDAIKSNIVPIDSMDPRLARSLLNGDEKWVAHRGIDRTMLVKNLQKKGAQKRAYEVGPGLESIEIDVDFPDAWQWAKRVRT